MATFRLSINPWDYHYVSPGITSTSCALYPTSGILVKDLRLCDLWRKIVAKNQVWNQLPSELIEHIAAYLIEYRDSGIEPSGHINWQKKQETKKTKTKKHINWQKKQETKKTKTKKTK